MNEQETGDPIISAILSAGVKPAQTASQAQKKNYSESLSNHLALAVAAALRSRGVEGCQPGEGGGRERQFAGGIGAKKVDVSFATEEDGLILAVSIKTISFPDSRTKNFQKNLTNRRGDLLAEATTLHKRFPYAVLGGLFFFDEGADKDGTDRRSSTFRTAMDYFAAFDDRRDHSDAVEKYEALAIALYRPAPRAGYQVYRVRNPGVQANVDSFLSTLVSSTAVRNPDRFRFISGRLEGK